MTVEQVGPYLIERYTADRRDALLGLEQRLWSPDLATTAAHFEWKYLNNPYGTAIHFYLATLDGAVVGANGMYWSRWEHDDRGTTTDLLCRADTVIDPDHRGNGILAGFFRILRRDLGDRGIPLLLGTSAGAPVTHTALADGWTRCETLRTHRRPAPATPTRKGLGVRFARWLGRPIHERDEPWAQAPMVDGIALETEPRPDAMADLMASLPYDGRIRHLRDAGYYAWRFRNPLSTFRFLFAGDAPLKGYLVAQAHSDPARRLGTAIVDWESTDEETAMLLIEAAVEAFGHRDLFLSTNHLTSHRMDSLKRLGFEQEQTAPDAFRPAVIVRSTDDRPPETWRLGHRLLTDFDDWDWRDIYSDNY